MQNIYTRIIIFWLYKQEMCMRAYKYIWFYTYLNIFNDHFMRTMVAGFITGCSRNYRLSKLIQLDVFAILI